VMSMNAMAMVAMDRNVNKIVMDVFSLLIVVSRAFCRKGWLHGGPAEDAIQTRSCNWIGRPLF